MAHGPSGETTTTRDAALCSLCGDWVPLRTFFLHVADCPGKGRAPSYRELRAMVEAMNARMDETSGLLRGATATLKGGGR